MTSPFSKPVGRLVLWDIDHTLIETGGVGRELYQRAFEVATGRRFKHQASISGSTELRILSETLVLHGVEPSMSVRYGYAAALAAGYRDQVVELRRRGRALPGASVIQKVFAARDDVQTVVTGNLREVAEIKLHVFDLDAHLDLTVGAFAEDDEDRAILVAVAVARARRKYGDEITRRVIMFGDTPSDVRAGLAHHVPVIGVATGRSTQAELAEVGAAATLPDLADSGHVCAMVDGLVAL